MLYTKRGTSLKRKIELRTVKGNGCWTWIGYHDTTGYPITKVPKVANQKPKNVRVCRILCRAKGKQVSRHTCDNPGCVNPAHIVVGTQSENAQDMVLRGRCWSVKLKPSQVLAIRKSKGPLIDQAKKYGVSKSLVSVIRRGERWQCLDRKNEPAA